MPRKEINLLPREEFEKKPLGRFLTWALSAGRYIVIFTELAVLLTFLSRFKLDRDLSDLADKISQKQKQIEAYSDFEKEFRSFQKRLATIKTVQESQIQGKEIVLAVAQSLPADVSLDNLSFSKEEIQTSGMALSDAGLKAFVTNLSASGKFTQISIDKIAKEEEGGLSFAITFKMKKEKENAS